VKSAWNDRCRPWLDRRRRGRRRSSTRPANLVLGRAFPMARASRRCHAGDERLLSSATGALLKAESLHALLSAASAGQYPLRVNLHSSRPILAYEGLSTFRPGSLSRPSRSWRQDRRAAPAGSTKIKHDGYRMMVRRDGAAARLYSPNANDWTARLRAIADRCSTDQSQELHDRRRGGCARA
jgi:hypothetical protein